MAETIFYAGYGANRDPEMVGNIIKANPMVLGALVLQDVELCVQAFNQVPDARYNGAALSPKDIMVKSWGENSDFETYTIRPRAGAEVSAMLYKLSELERALVAAWEMSDLGWFKPMTVTARRDDGSEIQAQTEGLWEGQEIVRVVDGMNYETYLGDPAVMREITDVNYKIFMEQHSIKERKTL